MANEDVEFEKMVLMFMIGGDYIDAGAFEDQFGYLPGQREDRMDALLARAIALARPDVFPKSGGAEEVKIELQRFLKEDNLGKIFAEIFKKLQKMTENRYGKLGDEPSINSELVALRPLLDPEKVEGVLLHIRAARRGAAMSSEGVDVNYILDMQREEEAGRGIA